MPKDKCNNCGSTKSKMFWDFEDGTVLCDDCNKKYGDEWQEEIDKDKPSKINKKYVFIILLIIFIIGCYFVGKFFSSEDVQTKLFGCPANYTQDGTTCTKIERCSDGTIEQSCSENKPYRCIDNQLIPDSGVCGCPNNYTRDVNSCKKIERCPDGTIYSTCSSTKPLFCQNGTYIELPNVCGCPEGKILINDTCAGLDYNPTEKWLVYHYNRTGWILKVQTYQGVNLYLDTLRHPLHFYDYDYIIGYLNEPTQKKYLDPIVEKIRNITNNTDEQAKIAISLVQNIPYDEQFANDSEREERYPYQTIYLEKGICTDKSYLLAYLLRGLNFSVAILDFGYPDNHMAVGVKCPEQYYFRNSSYCMVETTGPTQAINPSGLYPINGITRPLTLNPEVIPISDGISINNTKYDNNWFEICIITRCDYDGENCMTDIVQGTCPH